MLVVHLGCVWGSSVSLAQLSDPIVLSLRIEMPGGSIVLKEGANEQCWLCTYAVSGARFNIWAPLISWLCTCVVSEAGFYI